MEKFNVVSFICPKEEIKILGGSAKKYTGTTGPVGIGYYSKRPSTAKTSIRFNAVAKVLDYLLIDKSINALAGSHQIYGEYLSSKGLCSFTFDGEKILYTGEALVGIEGFIPLMLYAIKDGDSFPDTYKIFNTIKDKYISSGMCEISDALELCDTFYYEYAYPLKEDIEIVESGLAIETVEAAVRSGLLKPLKTVSTIPGIIPLSTKDVKVKKKAKKHVDIFDDIKAGKEVIPYSWNEDQQTKIPRLKFLESYVPAPAFYSTLTKIRQRLERVLLRMDGGIEGVEAIDKDYVNFFITGRPGTGKTTMAYALGAALGMPTYTVPMTKNSEEDIFLGMNKVIDGVVTSVPTEFVEAYTNGGIIIIEEINLPDPGVVMGSIGQAIEFPFVLLKDGYKPVRRHPLCIVIGTMNIGTFGSKGVNQALSSRFKQTYILDDPTEDDFISILEKKCSDKSKCEWVYTAYNKICAYLNSPSVNAEDICLNLSMRGCLGALENIEEGQTGKDAIRDSLIGKISEIDLEIADHAYQDVVLSLPDQPWDCEDFIVK